MVPSQVVWCSVGVSGRGCPSRHQVLPVNEASIYRSFRTSRKTSPETGSPETNSPELIAVCLYCFPWSGLGDAADILLIAEVSELTAAAGLVVRPSTV